MNQLARHGASPAELQEQLIALRGGLPFLLYRDGEQQQRILCLEGQHEITVGRDESADVALSWDNQVSRLHAELACVAGQWTVVDDGLSSNGSFVNGERISGRRPAFRRLTRCASGARRSCSVRPRAGSRR
jgi:pSer/pThr/pTyr-binding forkhead associated (FHA) protein